MILLFTDFGLTDPYVGQMHRQIQQMSTGSPVIDLFHSLPAFNVAAASYLLPAYCTPLKNAAYCCVVDPGVGGDRAAVFFQINGCYYIGPDNGIFEILARRFELENVRQIDWRPEVLSDSFHGRDLFAPVAAMLRNGDTVESSKSELTRYPELTDELDKIVYLDHFGNIMIGRRANTIRQNTVIEYNGNQFEYARTFSAIPKNSGFWYENSNGLIEIAINSGNVRNKYNAKIGDAINIIN